MISKYEPASDRVLVPGYAASPATIPSPVNRRYRPFHQPLRASRENRLRALRPRRSLAEVGGGVRYPSRERRSVRREAPSGTRCRANTQQLGGGPLFCLEVMTAFRSWSSFCVPSWTAAHQSRSNYFTEIRSGSKAGSYLRPIDFCTQL